MKKYKFFFMGVFVCLFLFRGTPGFPQCPAPLYMPENITQAYQMKTRSPDGRPGPAYWQNHADYHIRVQLIPRTRMVTGEETILYYNESPDSLDRLVLRLYQDYLKKGNFRDFAVDTNDLHDGVRLSRLSVDGTDLTLTDNSSVVREGTNLIIRLKQMIPPHSTVQVGAEWQFPLPLHSSNRYGAMDSTAFFVAYWYPQIAVYDDIDGWDVFSFHGIQEFYNDFNNFDVAITVPRGFVVWATGRLQNPGETLSPVCLSRYRKLFTDTLLLHIITPEDLRAGSVTVDKPEITWRYTARRVTDFAFATSNRYLWDAVALPAEQQPDGRILISAAYEEGANYLPQAAETQKQTIRYFSQEMPGVPFPFPSFTLFRYKGGMEFPMMNSQGVVENFPYHIFVVTHELSHSYFPLLVGVNERKYAWMDESWAMLLPLELQNRILKKDISVVLGASLYEPFVGGEFDIPPMVPSIIFGPDCFDEYRYNVYARPFVAYKLLMQMTGKRHFLAALQEYIHRWRGKHPVPYDFFFSINDALGEDLSWFWKPWFFEFAAPDLAITEVNSQPGKMMITITNNGGLPLPVHLTVTYADGTKRTVTRPMNVWAEGDTSIKIDLPFTAPVHKIELGKSGIPDVNKKDNVFVPGQL